VEVEDYTPYDYGLVELCGTSGIGKSASLFFFLYLIVNDENATVLSLPSFFSEYTFLLSLF
jgi:hypothetical protein